MLGSSAASYLKFPRTWLEVNGSTTVQLHFAMVTRCWIAPIHRWSYWDIHMLQYRNISAPLVQAPSRQLSKRDVFCISGTSADGVSKWGWVSLHNRAGKVLPSLSKCQKRHSSSFLGLICLFADPKIVFITAVTGYCTCTYLEFAWLISLTNGCSICSSVFDNAPVSLKLGAIKSCDLVPDQRSCQQRNDLWETNKSSSYKAITNLKVHFTLKSE